MTHRAWTFLFFVLGFCVVGCGGSDSQGTSQSAGIPDGYADLCGVNSVTCATGATPLSMLGTYTGTGTTTVTSNETWRVGDSDAFTAVITTQTGETLSGSFDLGGYHMDVQQAAIRGTSTEFAIFGTNSFSAATADAGTDSTCSWEARAVITGTQTTAASVTTVAGYVNLQFTKNIHGPGCTQDQINNYPGTGATFKYTATRAP